MVLPPYGCRVVGAGDAELVSDRCCSIVSWYASPWRDTTEADSWWDEQENEVPRKASQGSRWTLKVVDRSSKAGGLFSGREPCEEVEDDMHGALMGEPRV